MATSAYSSQQQGRPVAAAGGDLSSTGGKLRATPYPSESVPGGSNIISGLEAGDFSDFYAANGLGTEEQNSAYVAKQQEQAAATAAQKELEDQAKRKPVYAANALEQTANINEESDSAPTSFYEQQKRDVDAFSSQVGNSDINFRGRLQDYLNSQHNVADFLKEKIKQVEKKKTGIDLSPLLLLMEDPNRAAAAAKILDLGEAYTQESKKAELDNLKLKLAQYKDSVGSNVKSLIESHEAKLDQKRFQLAQLQGQITDKGIDRLGKQVKEFEDKPQVKWANDVLSSSAVLVSKIANEDSWKIENGKRILKPEVAKDIKFARAKQLNGAGVLTNQDFEQAGGSQKLLNQYNELIDKLVSGTPFSEQTIIGLVDSARVSAKFADKLLKKKTEEAIKDAPNLVGVSPEFANKYWTQKYSDISNPLTKEINQPISAFGKKDFIKQKEEAEAKNAAEQLTQKEMEGMTDEQRVGQEVGKVIKKGAKAAIETGKSLLGIKPDIPSKLDGVSESNVDENLKALEEAEK